MRTSTMSLQQHLLTADEFFWMPEEPGYSFELVHGRLVRMSKPTALHAFVSLRLDRALGRYVDEHALGAASAADSGFLLARAPDSVRAPDVWFIRRDRIPVGGPPDAFWTGAPDLAVEVRSKNDRWPDILEKVDEYFAAGTQLVWVIEPIRREVVVFRADMPAITLMSTDELDGQDVVPGFHLPVRDLFE